LVSKVHAEGRRYAGDGRSVILIGHDGHPEVEGTLGRIQGEVHLVSTVEEVTALQVSDPERVSYVTQTTLSVDDTKVVIDALKAKFPAIVGPNTKDICYATQNRQAAVRKLAREVDVLLVVGSPNSSNSNRLREIGAELGVPSYLIENAEALDPSWVMGKNAGGVTAGASAPEVLVLELLDALKRIADTQVEILPGVDENIRFRLPPQLVEPRAATA
jgi:4-hydroxy-3-methylbut-2-enyl diphosphate reductase